MMTSVFRFLGLSFLLAVAGGLGALNWILFNDPLWLTSPNAPRSSSAWQPAVSQASASAFRPGQIGDFAQTLDRPVFSPTRKPPQPRPPEPPPAAPPPPEPPPTGASAATGALDRSDPAHGHHDPARQPQGAHSDGWRTGRNLVRGTGQVRRMDAIGNRRR